MCYSLWYHVPRMLPGGSLEAPLPGYRPATSWVHDTTSCNTQSSAPEDGRVQRPKYFELIGFINKPLLLHLVGVYIIYVGIISGSKQCNSCCVTSILKTRFVKLLTRFHLLVVTVGSHSFIQFSNYIPTFPSFYFILSKHLRSMKYEGKFTSPTPISILFISILMPTTKQSWSFCMYYNFPYGLNRIEILKYEF